MRKIFRSFAGIIGAGVGAVVVGAIVAGNRRVDYWESLELEDSEHGETCYLANGWRIHYSVKGEGPTVVLVHGFMDSLDSWRYNVDALARNHRVIAIDMPGFGFSERVTEPVYSLKQQAQVLKEFLDVVGVERASLIGHSMGGALVGQFAYDFPSRVDKLVLEAAAVYLKPPPFENIFEWLPRSVARGVVGLYSGSRRAVNAGLKNAYGERTLLDSESVRVRLRSMRVRGSVDALLAMVESPRESDLPDELSHIEHPTLIVWGGRDHVVPLKHGRRLRRALPTSRLVIFPTAGHLPHEEFPEKVNELLVTFLDEGLEGLKRLEEVDGQDT